MKIAVRKEPAHIPGAGFHYLAFPAPMDGKNFIPELFEMMGHVIVDVPDEQGERLIAEACSALKHQLEVAHLTERAIQEQARVPLRLGYMGDINGAGTDPDVQ